MVSRRVSGFLEVLLGSAAVSTMALSGSIRIGPDSLLEHSPRQEVCAATGLLATIGASVISIIGRHPFSLRLGLLSSTRNPKP